MRIFTRCLQYEGSWLGHPEMPIGSGFHSNVSEYADCILSSYRDSLRFLFLSVIVVVILVRIHASEIVKNDAQELIFPDLTNSLLNDFS